MKFFIDTADIDEIRDLAASGLVDGVTTNPSLVAKSGRSFFQVLREICEVVSGPVSAEVTATDHEAMVAEGRRLAALAPNITVKVPLTPDGIRACKALSGEGTMVNAGASFVSPFVGRLDDIGAPGMGLIEEICAIYRQYPDFRTEVLVASIRGPMHVVEAAKIGAHVATIPPQVLRQLFAHPLTDKGLAAFLADWAETGQSILEAEAAE
jgi:transaldolase